MAVFCVCVCQWMGGSLIPWVPRLIFTRMKLGAEVSGLKNETSTVCGSIRVSRWFVLFQYLARQMYMCGTAAD